MTRPRIDLRWKISGLQAVIVENRFLRAVVLPEYGGRIWSLVYKPLDREVLWQSPRVPLDRPPFGATYDDVWCGGWDEMFPNDAPGVINGEPYPDHGELWASGWEWRAESCDETVLIELSCNTPISAVRFTKRIALGCGAGLTVDYAAVNRSSTPLPFLFKLHPAFAIAPGFRIDFPPMQVRLEPEYPGSLGGAEPEFVWPHARRGSELLDLSEVPPPESRQLYFGYGTGFDQGWCAVTDPEARLSAGIVFSPETFRSCWLFASFGGWRNNMVAVAEPATGWPLRIECAIENGTAGYLQPGARYETRAVLCVQEGLTRVTGVTPDGELVG